MTGTVKSPAFIIFNNRMQYFILKTKTHTQPDTAHTIKIQPPEQDDTVPCIRTITPTEIPVYQFNTRYKVTVHINNSEGGKNCAYKVNE